MAPVHRKFPRKLWQRVLLFMLYACFLALGYYFLPGPEKPLEHAWEPDVSQVLQAMDPRPQFPPQPDPIENKDLTFQSEFKHLLTKSESKPGDKPARIAIIIDDMGLDRKRSRRALGLPAPVTLAFLPYAPDLAKQTQIARQKGHDVMIHMPMQPLDSKLDPGPIALRVGMTQDELSAALDKAFESFSGYVGLNNHMGSLLTQDREAMDVVARAAKARGLFLVDSKTGPGSQVFAAAQAAGTAYAARDVFLDHTETPAFVAEALKKLEAKAHRRGTAIAIGHPKDVTLDALEAWIPTLAQKGIMLVPVQSLVKVTHPTLSAPDYSDSVSVEP